MPQLLLELFSEEIPARMQGQAARELERMAGERLKAAGLDYENLRTFAGSRRLTLVVDGLPAAQEDRSEELKGPKASAPPQALDGFLRKTGLTREQLTKRDGVYFAVIHKPGRQTPEIVAEMVEQIVHIFPWPKSMRWGTGTLRWIRPLKRILCLFDGVVVPFAIDGIESGNVTEGHRFMGADHAPFSVNSFDDYGAKLRDYFVVLEAETRRERIVEGARAVCQARGLEPVEDVGLLDEVAGLAEWPVPILGDMDPAFLDLPPEVITTSMRTHQKYFAVRDPATGALAPHFVVVANIEAKDGGRAIAAGNARVLSARLSDARFFWNEDRKAGAFDRWLEKLNGVTFHAKLGTMAERVERITALAREIAPLVGADPELAAEAARLAKADLASGMVGEFPELQGIMGGYYAREMLRRGGAERVTFPFTPSDGFNDGEEDPLATVDLMVEKASAARYTPEQADQIADAIRDHYKPLGPTDTVPTAPVTVAVALADKLDTLVSFFAIGEKPTGSKDPYALRRAALGGIRLILAIQARIGLRRVLQPPLLFSLVHANVAEQRRIKSSKEYDVYAEPMKGAAELMRLAREATVLGEKIRRDRPLDKVDQANIKDVLAFFADRLKVLLREEGKRHDLVDAVFALGDDDLVRIVARVEALDQFLGTEDGANLLAGYRRAVNILKAEAKKNPGESYEGQPELRADAPPEETELQKALRTTLSELEPKLSHEDFTGAMASLARLRAPVDAFFDRVLVNDPDPEVRLNRLRLLSQIRDAANRVADFSLIAG